MADALPEKAEIEAKLRGGDQPDARRRLQASSGKQERSNRLDAAKRQAVGAVPRQHRARRIGGEAVQGSGKGHRPRRDHPRRAAHRRPRHQDGAADHLPRSASCRAPTARRCSPAARPRRIVVATLGTGQDEQIIDALEGEYRAALHAALQLPALLDRRGRPHGLARAGARSATASSPGARCGRCCRPRKPSPTRSASSRRSPSRTARPRWPRCAAPRCR